MRALLPNLEAPATLPPGGLIVTARSDDPAYDFVPRYFAPAFDILEDPVTGSAAELRAQGRWLSRPTDLLTSGVAVCCTLGNY